MQKLKAKAIMLANLALLTMGAALIMAVLVGVAAYQIVKFFAFWNVAFSG